MKLKESDKNYPISKLEKITNPGWNNLIINEGLSVTFSFIGEHIMLIALKGDLSKLDHSSYFELRETVLKEFMVMYRLTDFVELFDVKKAVKISSKQLNLLKCRDQIEENIQVIKQIVFNLKKRNGIFSLFSQDNLISKTRDICEDYDASIKSAIQYLKENENYTSLKADKLITKPEWRLSSNGSESVIKTIPKTLIYVQHKGFLVEPAIEDFTAVQLGMFQSEKLKSIPYYRITDYRQLAGCSIGAWAAYVKNLKALHKAFGAPEMEYIVGSDEATRESIQALKKEIDWSYTFCDNYNEVIIEIHEQKSQTCLTSNGKRISINGSGPLTKDFITFDHWSYEDELFSVKVQAVEDKTVYLKLAGEFHTRGGDAVFAIFNEVLSNYFNSDALYLLLDVSRLGKIKSDVREKLNDTLNKFKNIYQKNCKAIYISGASPKVTAFINALKYAGNIRIIATSSLGEALIQLENHAREDKKHSNHSNMAYSQLVLEDNLSGEHRYAGTEKYANNPVLKKIYSTIWSPENRENEPLNKKSSNFDVLNGIELLRINADSPFIETAHQNNTLLIKNIALENAFETIEEITQVTAILPQDQQQQFISSNCTQAKKEIPEISKLLQAVLESPHKTEEELLIRHFIKAHQPDFSAVKDILNLILFKNGERSLEEWRIDVPELLDLFKVQCTTLASSLERSVQFKISNTLPSILIGDPLHILKIITLATHVILKTAKIGSPLVMIDGVEEHKNYRLQLTIEEEENTLRKDDLISLSSVTTTGYPLYLATLLAKKMGGDIQIETPTPKKVILSCHLNLKSGDLFAHQGVKARVDAIQSFKLKDSNIQGKVVHLEKSYKDALVNGNYPEQIKLLAGEMISAASLLSSALPFQGRVKLQMQSSKIRKLLVEVTHTQEIRAAVKWTGELSDAKFSDLLKNSIFQVKIEHNNGESHQEDFPLQVDSIHQFLEHYLTQSTHLPCKVWLNSPQDDLLGILIQKPKKQDEVDIETPWKLLVHAIEDSILSGEQAMNTQNLLSTIEKSVKVILTDQQRVRFNCNCSKENCENAILNLGPKKIEDLMTKQGRVTIKCDYCHSSYTSNKSDLTRLHQISQIQNKQEIPEA